jgi:hypothetical protein
MLAFLGGGDGRLACREFGPPLSKRPIESSVTRSRQSVVQI